MPQTEETERCYVASTAPDDVMIAFFDGDERVPIAPRSMFACRHSFGGVLEERENVAFTLLSDYLARHGMSTEAVAIGAAALAPQFTEQFLDVQLEAALFIEEYRVEDWLRVMRMVGEAA